MNRVFILTISDRASKKEKEDLTGPELIKNVKAAGFEITGYRILPDEKDAIRDEIMEMSPQKPLRKLQTGSPQDWQKQ